jgi:hypothetical protein
MSIEILFIGFGKQAIEKYRPTLVEMAREGVQVVGIADIAPEEDMLRSMFSVDIGVPEILHLTGDMDRDLEVLSRFLERRPSVSTTIISCPPVLHSRYTLWAIGCGLDVVCDKPPIAIPFQSGDRRAHQTILNEYLQIRTALASSQHRRKGRQCDVILPLERRMFSPYRDIARAVRDVFETTGEIISRGVLHHNAGVFRFPDEFDRPGAHGYRDGMGSLTQTSYHFLDLIAFLELQTDLSPIVVDAGLIDIRKVSDVAQDSSSSSLGNLLGRRVGESRDLSFEGGSAEVDLVAQITFRREALPPSKWTAGLIHRGCTRRTLPTYGPFTTHDEGRVRDTSLTLHQGPFQSVSILRYDAPTQTGYTRFVRRLHPHLANELCTDEVTISDSIRTPSEAEQEESLLFKEIIRSMDNRDEGLFKTLGIENQALTIAAYAEIIKAAAMSGAN